MTSWVDVTDLIRFAQHTHPATGVQRVVSEVVPLLPGVRPVAFDPLRAKWILVEGADRDVLLDQGLRAESQLPREQVADAARSWLARLGSLDPVAMTARDSLVLLGSPWIDQGVFLAVQRAAARGVRIVPLLLDLTPLHEAGHPPEVTQGFRRYLALLARRCPVVLAISAATAQDAADYCRTQGWPSPRGVVTQLPPGLLPTPASASAPTPWPRPYVLFVGTIEARKGHLRVLEAWRKLRERDANTPDLVCIGRWGWGSDPFREAWLDAGGPASGVHVLDHGVGDAELGTYYAGSLATLYPSSLEGWGLPVTESLAFGKLPITSNRSSMPEAGLGLAVLVDPDDPTAIADAITRDVLNDEARHRHEEGIRSSTAFRNPRTWRQVAEVVTDLIGQAAAMADVDPPMIDIGREYVLGIPASVDDASNVRIEAITKDRGTPLLGSIVDHDVVVTDALVNGDVLQPTTWGYPVVVEGSLDIAFRRAQRAPMLLLIATAPIVGSGTVDIGIDSGPRQRVPLAYGEVISLPISAGEVGDVVRVHIDVVAQDKKDGGAITFQSIVILDSQDVQAQIAILERVARARSVQWTEASAEVAGLRAQLEGLLTSRSWRITAPLRRVTGEGA